MLRKKVAFTHAALYIRARASSSYAVSRLVYPPDRVKRARFQCEHLWYKDMREELSHASSRSELGSRHVRGTNANVYIYTRMRTRKTHTPRVFRISQSGWDALLVIPNDIPGVFPGRSAVFVKSREDAR